MVSLQENRTIKRGFGHMAQVFDQQPNDRICLIGLLSETDFAAARAREASLGQYASFEEFVDAQLGRQISLEAAGVHAVFWEMSLDEFLAWRRGTPALQGGAAAEP